MSLPVLSYGLLLITSNAAIISVMLVGVGIPAAAQTLIQTMIALLLSGGVLLRSRRILGASLISIYALLQVINAIAHGADGLSIAATFAGFMLIIFLINYLLGLEFGEVIRLIKKTAMHSVYLLIMADMANWLIHGRALAVLIQVEMPVIVLALVLVYSYLPKGTVDRIVILRTLMLLLGWITISLFFDSWFNIQIIQEIPIALTFLIIALKVIFSWSEKNPLYVFGHRFLWYRMFLWAGLICAIVFFQQFLIEILSVREGSGLIRIAVSTSMVTTTLNSFFSLLFGSGFGSSAQLFDVSSLLPVGPAWEGYDYGPHSGLIILFFENGLLGLIVVACWLFFSFRRCLRNGHGGDWNMPNHNLVDSKDIRPNAILLVGVVWVLQNLLYVHGIPAAEMFYQGQIPLYSLSLALIIRSIGRPSRIA